MLKRLACFGAVLCLSCLAQSGASRKASESNVIQRMPSNPLAFDFQKKSPAAPDDLQASKRSVEGARACGHILVKRVDPSADRGLLVPTPPGMPRMPREAGLPVCPADVR
jgi:hypothetical protein